MENNDEKNANKLTNQDSMQMATILVGGGTLWLLYLLLKRNWNIFSLFISVGMVAAGADLILKDRQKHIKQTGDEIMSQLDELDPVARAEVIKYLADHEAKKISG